MPAMGSSPDLEPRKATGSSDEGRETRARRRATDDALQAERASGERPAIEPSGALLRTTSAALEQERAHEDDVLQHERAFARERARLLGEANEARALAESATRMRDEFLAIVSHDLKNPVGAILMNAALLVARAPANESGSRLRRSLEGIERSASRALRMIDDLLDLAAIDSGRLALTLRPEPVAELVAEAVESLRLRAIDGSVRLETGVEPGAAREIPCDAGRIQQVLANLIGNAIKFTPPGGSVRVTVEHVEGGLRFAVSDTGPGIAEEQRERVFARFWQAVPGAHGGRGLGLYIARSIVEAHRGRIWVAARCGGGSTFCFDLPAQRAPGPQPAVA